MYFIFCHICTLTLDWHNMAKRNSKKKDFFWLSYSDLMTSLFFVMLVMFILVYSMQNNIIKDLTAAKEELERIKEIAKATKALTDGGLFVYNESCKRFELNQDILFKPGNPAIPKNAYKQLIEAGKKIQKLVKDFEENKKVKFVIAVDGRAAKYLKRKERYKNKKYAISAKELSYGRSLSLYYLWKKNGIELNTSNSEIYISGSGFDGLCRYNGRNEDKNKRFIIQVIPYLIE